MKKINLLFATLVSSILLSGCIDLNEEPKALPTLDFDIKTPNELEGLIVATYRGLASDAGWGFSYGMASYFGSDDLAAPFHRYSSCDFDKLQGDYGYSNTNYQWSAPFLSICHANAILSSIDRVTFTSETDKNGALGQACYMRGMCYFYLVRTFGELPIVTEYVIDVADPLDRQPVKEVYALIVDDLKKAENLLPESWPGQPGKATKWVAKALLADVYLTMAGWPLNETSNYLLAADKADEVIKSGKYQLVERYGDVFKTNNNSECIFALQYNTAGGLPRRSTGQFCIPDDETSEKGQAGWDDYYAEINFFKKAPKCQRTDDTFYLKIKHRGTQNADGTYNFTILDWNDPLTSNQHPFFKKFRYGVAAPGTTLGDGCKETETRLMEMNPSTDKTLDLIRYPMILLNYAEASAMAGNPTAAGYGAINQVRRRAGLPDLTPGLSQIAFRDSVVFERAYECAGEFGVRWFDIQRLQLLPKVIKDRLRGIFPTDRATGWENKINPKVADGNGNIVDQAFLQTRYYAPIPYSEMLRNPNWTQNLGY